MARRWLPCFQATKTLPGSFPLQLCGTEGYHAPWARSRLGSRRGLGREGYGAGGWRLEPANSQKSKGYQQHQASLRTPTPAEPIFPALEALTACLTRPRPPLSRAPAQAFYRLWLTISGNANLNNLESARSVITRLTFSDLRMRCLRLFRDHYRLVSLNPFED